MKTKVYRFVGPNQEIVDIVAPVDIDFPSIYLVDYESYCGAGSGFGDIIVPEKMWGLTISIACYVHDYMWEHAEASWEAFHASNAVFTRNLMSCIQTQSRSNCLKRLRMYRAVTYFSAVDSIGKTIFWGIKEKQRVA